MLGRHSYDLLLLDLALPGESGIDLLPRIKTIAPELPIVMITAYGTVGNVVGCDPRGRFEFCSEAVGQREAAGGHSRGDWAVEG